MGAKVISLDAALRLTRANTRRSSAYVQKANVLGELLRRRLSLLEERLFISHSGLEACQAGQLQKPESCFDAPEGRIWWFFSGNTHRFVLLDFDLSTGGNGGLPIPDPWENSPGRRCNCISTTTTSRRVAARYSKVAQGLRTGIAASANGFIADALRSVRATFAICKAHNLKWLASSVVSDAFYTNRNNIANKLTVQPSWVPAWSILSEFVLVPEQIENTFARSILAGEALCRSVELEFNRHLDVSFVHSAISDSDLLEDSVCALKFMFSCADMPKTKLNSFNITRCMGTAPLADDWILVIARSEITAHLSLRVADRAFGILSNREKWTSEDWASRVRIVMKHYAALGEFACLSERLFKAGYPRVDVQLLLRAQSEIVRDGVSIETLRKVGKFDLAIHDIATGFAGFTECEDEGDVDNDLTQLHDRLAGLTRELLGPVG